MKTLITFAMLFFISAAASATLQLPLTNTICHPAGSIVCIGPCLFGGWGPGNGSSCTYSRIDTAPANGEWGCSDPTTLTHIQNNKFCHCEWDFVAAIAIAVNPAPNCQPNPSSQAWWPYSYYCI